MFAGHYVLVDVGDNSPLIVGKPQGMLGQQLKPHPAHFLNIIIFLNYSLNYYLLINYIITKTKMGLIQL